MTRKRIPQINLPEYDKASYVILGSYILFMQIGQDETASNPCEDDGVGMIRSFSRRHFNNIDPNEAVALMESDPDVIPLSYFEHGNCLWMVKELPTPPGVEFRWDGVKFAGIWIPDESVRESYMGQDGLTRREWMTQQAKSACETYTQWLNGEVYDIHVSVYKVKRGDGEIYTRPSDYRLDKELFEEPWIGGLYGWDYAKEELVGQVKAALKELKYSRRAIDAAVKEAA